MQRQLSGMAIIVAASLGVAALILSSGQVPRLEEPSPPRPRVSTVAGDFHTVQAAPWHRILMQGDPTPAAWLHLPYAGAELQKLPPEVKEPSEVPIGLDLVWHFGNSIRAVTGDGAIAYVGHGNRLMVIDLSDPSTPKPLGRSDSLGGKVDEVALVGRHVLSAAGPDLYLHDVSDPSRLRQIGPPIEGLHARAVSTNGPHAFVATPLWLAVVDFTDPAQPKVVRLEPESRYDRLGSVAYWDGHVLAGYKDGLRVYDASEPTRLRKVGALPYQAFLGIDDIAVEDGVAVLMESGYGVRVVDVTVPSRPTLRGFANLPEAYTKLSLDDGLAAVSSRSGEIYLLDLRDPAIPHGVWRGPFATPADIADLWQNQRRLIVANEGSGLRTYQVTDGGTIEWRGKLDTAGEVYDFTVTDEAMLVAAGGAGMRVLERVPAGPPRETSLVDLGHPAWTVERSGPLAFVAGERWLSVIHLTGDSGPRAVGSLPFEGRIRVAAAVDRHAYVIAHGALHVVDATSPEQPHLVSSLPMPWYASEHEGPNGALALADGLAVAVSRDEAAILDSVDPGAPFVIGRLAAQEYEMDVALQGRTVFLYHEDRGVEVLDLRNPAVPEHVADLASVSAYGSGWLELDGSHLFVGADDRIDVWRTTPGIAPQPRGFIDRPLSGLIHAAGDILFFGSHGGGGITAYRPRLDPNGPANQ